MISAGRLSEVLKPSKKMITLYFIYLMIVLLPILAVGIAVTRIVYISLLQNS